ncbi:MAG: hypothetical protein AB8I08_19230 [Sandaracinaceae bacterium]
MAPTPISPVCIRLVVLALTASLLPSPGAAQAVPFAADGLGEAEAPRLRAAAHPVEELGTPRTELLLLAPEAVLGPWTVALQVELAERGTLVVPLPAPSGAGSRVAEGQRAMLARRAAAAVTVEAMPDTYDVRLISADGTRVRVTPSRQADPRTMALIIASLLDEPRVSSRARDDGPPAEADPASGDAPSSAPFETPTGSSVEWWGLAGTGGYLRINDQFRMPGVLIRGGIGMVYDHLELAALADFGVMLEQLSGIDLDEPLALQTMLRVCLEGGFRIPIDSVGLHGGVRACGGYAEQHTMVFPPGFVGGFFLDGIGGLLSAGGYLAVSLGLTESIRLLARAELELGVHETSAEEVIPTVSTLLSFRVP